MSAIVKIFARLVYEGRDINTVNKKIREEVRAAVKELYGVEV